MRYKLSNLRRHKTPLLCVTSTDVELYWKGNSHVLIERELKVDSSEVENTKKYIYVYMNNRKGTLNGYQLPTSLGFL